MDIIEVIIKAFFFIYILAMIIYLRVAIIKTYRNTEELKKQIQLCNSKESYIIDLQKKMLKELEEIKDQSPKE